MEAIILASGSPRRSQILTQMGVAFEKHAAEVDEHCALGAREAVAELSQRKAQAVAAQFPGRVVLAADTLVALDNQPLGKPKDEADALRMLRQLQGEMHSVFTGVTLIVKENGSVISKQTFSQETRVYLYAMTDEEIQDYIATGEPMDKAGAYGIQGRFAAYVEGIEGDYNNVVGLPVSAVWQEIKEFCV